MTIGIIGAMEEEIAILLGNMEDQKEITVANCLFIEGKLCGKDVVLLKSGIGKVNAAMATTIMHERFQPSHVINTGSAGGFASDLEVGNVVISTQVVHHDVDVTAFDYAYGQVPGMPAMFAADTGLITLAVKAMNDLDIKAKTGIIATGDSFMDDPERVAFVNKKIPTMIAAEMEAAAVAQVCHQYKKPFVIIRALSDIAGKQSSISFDAFLEQAAKHASKLVMMMVSQL
ncbi:5'-methylthioadenosine/S-adenosylhomocysteine nucleosidase [Virgibacillus dakarensis]|uniref:5'-methylthioadenosine/S-adenosylhomocysteine nucleosidase n=1 Tax=Lentibacillus populi TaxID=1827502 RepID=A0A9W5X3U0_9BACI|nr:5'-methylthioadenosine/S-adenosylhomocysteine nucleosidase [Lentibacillus populi]MBT2215097.1 5'-methylthioadenosine/S-adenosylhomocysteine nucleosidase [Virgibacillus dakarensis]MTW84150.1 5'-methylthioadenosine/S-adenosylhomocysteine nucleosidase [Virgibacillus dakarensis]GGB28763.1 5'-methylthioadenosine/S-adenosylhomocysteine nucleosidase [Lentibacillus populi]